tara:strand:- start:733 stop:1284 length:552 start_codon:yes stop_codon:yes gene_type:complete
MSNYNYKPTTNYVKAQADYNLHQHNQKKFEEGLTTAYKGYKNLDKIMTLAREANFGKEVAKTFQNTQYPSWLTDALPNAQKVLHPMQDYEGVSGLMGHLKNFFNPSSQQIAMGDVGRLALQQPTANLIQEGMTEEAVKAGTQSTSSALMSNPTIQILTALMALGYGASKPGSTLNRWNKELGI